MPLFRSARRFHGGLPLPSGSSPKRERQYEHLKEGVESRGASTGRGKEIAARTVNKERARSGEATPPAGLRSLPPSATGPWTRALTRSSGSTHRPGRSGKAAASSTSTR
ncbi:plasmid stabilization protein [Streptomyces sp. NPDC090798]|uniref:plasmid stabilization protein n=1 Tax=Streptomyces sp. NPDC090798 TaxID=3365968 RepID=UPI0038050525